jgi:hypothetical protein
MPALKIYALLSRRLPIYEIAAILVARGHGLSEVRIPSHKAMTQSI